MSTANPSPVPDPRPRGGLPVRGETVPEPATPGGGGPRSAFPVVALVLALLAGSAAWLVGERFSGYYAPSHEAASHPYMFTALRQEKAAADSRNAAIAYGALGGLLGVALGLAGGLARRSIPAALAGAAAGGLLGGAAGAGLSFALVPYYLRSVDPAAPTLVLPVLTHGAIWTAIGAACGLAFGVGAGGWTRLIRAALGGAAGALLGTVAFEVLQAVGFPLVPIDDLLGPTPTLRLLADLCVAAFTAAGVAAQGLVSLGRAMQRAS